MRLPDRIPVAQLLRQGIHPSAGVVHPALGLGLFASLALRLQVAFEGALDERATLGACQPGLGVDGLEQIILEEHIDARHLVLLVHTLTANLSVCQPECKVCKVCALMRALAKQSVLRSRNGSSTEAGS